MFPEVEEKAKPLFKKMVQDLKARGIPEGLAVRAEERAREWLEGITRMLDRKNPELVKRAQEELLPEAIEHSKRWAIRLYEVITR